MNDTIVAKAKELFGEVTESGKIISREILSLDSRIRAIEDLIAEADEEKTDASRQQDQPQIKPGEKGQQQQQQQQ